MASYTAARHTGFAGGVLWELGMHGQHVAEARDRLTRSVTTRADGRGRTVHQIKLTCLLLTTGDPLEAAVLGTQALDWAVPLRSSRVLHGLRDLCRLAEPHIHLPEVADLRHRIRTELVM